MGFFDNEDNKELIESLVNDSDNSFLIQSYSLGSMVLYSPKINDFTIFNPSATLLNIDHYISIGIILEQIAPMKFIVLFKNVLNLEQETIFKATSNSTILAIAALFKEYTRRFKNKIPEQYSLIRNNIDFILPGNIQMDLIKNNHDLIIRNIGKLTSQEKAYELSNKLNTSNIFCNIGGHIAIWHMPTTNKKQYYEQIKTYISGYFLPIFILDLTNLK